MSVNISLSLLLLQSAIHLSSPSCAPLHCLCQRFHSPFLLSFHSSCPFLMWFLCMYVSQFFVCLSLSLCPHFPFLSFLLSNFLSISFYFILSLFSPYVFFQISLFFNSIFPPLCFLSYSPLLSLSLNFSLSLGFLLFSLSILFFLCLFLFSIFLSAPLNSQLPRAKGWLKITV